MYKDWSGETVTAAIQKMIEGELPQWRKPWRAMRAHGIGTVPMNAVSGNPYRGINFYLLFMLPYADKRFVTEYQATQLGGYVRGSEREHFHTVVLFKPTTRKEKDADGDEKTRKGLYMRTYKVWNVAQCENLTKLKPIKEMPAASLPTVTCQQVWDALGVQAQSGGVRASYSKTYDLIQMPLRDAFTDSDSYDATGLHEAVHATGHDSRCKREFGKRFGDDAYAAEELVAELGAAMLCAYFGVNSKLEHHASYIKHWQRIMKGDSRAIVTAASKAQQAMDYILKAMDVNVTAPEENEEIAQAA